MNERHEKEIREGFLAAWRTRFSIKNMNLRDYSVRYDYVLLCSAAQMQAIDIWVNRGLRLSEKGDRRPRGNNQMSLARGWFKLWAINLREEIEAKEFCSIESKWRSQWSRDPTAQKKMAKKMAKKKRKKSERMRERKKRGRKKEEKENHLQRMQLGNTYERRIILDRVQDV